MTPEVRRKKQLDDGIADTLVLLLPGRLSLTQSRVTPGTRISAVPSKFVF